MNWYYEGTKVTDSSQFPEGAFGFIYLLEFEDGTKYIGKKNIYSKSTLPSLKSGEQRPNSTRIGKNVNGKRKYFDIIQKESKWKTYKGTSKEIEGLKLKSKEILSFAGSGRELTYLEAKALFYYSVLETEVFRNSNILGRFYAGNIT